METMQAPEAFINAMGSIALDVRVLILQIMPFLLIILFAWGYASFLLGASKKLDLKKYLFTPLFLFLMVRFYPTVIDLTGMGYGVIIRAFDRPDNKKLYTEMMGAQEELNAYYKIAQKELDNQITYNERAKKGGFWRWLSSSKEEYAAIKAADKEIQKELEYLDELSSSSIQDALFSIWDFFSIPTIRIIRFIIDRIRDIFIALLVIFGCFAIFFEALPPFRGILSKWFKWYTAVTFWALTVCILDAMFLEYIRASKDMAEMFLKNAGEVGTIKETYGSFADGKASEQAMEVSVNVSDFGEKWFSYGGTEGINKAMQVIMVLCYCMVPFITALYIGGEQAGMFMSKIVSVGSMAAKQTLGSAIRHVPAVGGATRTAGGLAGAAAGLGKSAGLTK